MTINWRRKERKNKGGKRLTAWLLARRGTKGKRTLKCKSCEEEDEEEELDELELEVDDSVSFSDMGA
jgi:hypothetical protein